MQITIRGKNMDVPGALKDYIERKLGKMDRFFETDLSAQVTVSIERERHIVEVTMPLNGMLVRGEDEAQDLFSAVDKVMDKIMKQVEKYKTRLMQKRSRAAKEYEADLEPIPDTKIVRIKRFALKPITVDEAIMQMNLLGHDFFVFRNAETEAVSVVYRRKDGNYGLIEPED